jgi:sec-independent protein translocase protein TatB
MFDLDAGKLVVIGVVALVVIGPKDLPRVLRQVGQTVAKLRRMASDFQSQFMEAMREAELDDLRKDMAQLNDVAKVRAFNPLDTVRRELTDAMTDRPERPLMTSGELAPAEQLPPRQPVEAHPAEISPPELSSPELTLPTTTPTDDISPPPSFPTGEAAAGLSGPAHAESDGSDLAPAEPRHVGGA